MLTTEIKVYIDRSELCWLATSDADNMPYVSPKEIFTYFGDEEIIIANIASPKTMQNSFIDILVQNGYQLKGTAVIVNKSAAEFVTMEPRLLKMTEGKFPFIYWVPLSIPFMVKTIFFEIYLIICFTILR